MHKPQCRLREQRRVQSVRGHATHPLTTTAVACSYVSLLERDEQLRAVLDRFAGLDRSGHLFILSGEAGAGKTALVQELVDHHLGHARVLVGRCDDLFATTTAVPSVAAVAAHP